MHKKCLFIVALLFSLASALVAEAQSIKGVVYDDQNEPAIGATVRLKSDPKVGAQTGLDGGFVIKAREGDMLIISYIGFKTQEVKAKNGMKVVLEADAETLHEVVAMGYGSGRAISTTTASVVKVNSKELASKPSPNALESLQGKVAGLSVSSVSGEPGQTADIELHGSGSLGLSSAPLYILDGMPVGSGTIMGLNPNDFESVQVFKDASATAIYGSRASNGVIFITTKRGDAGQRARITLSTQYGISNVANREFYDQVMTADELEAFWIETGMKSKDYVRQYREKYPADTRWADYMLRKAAPMYNASLSISGGAGATQYYLSGQYYYQQGLWRGRSEYSKSNLRANISTKVNSWLSVYLNNAIYYDNTFTANSKNSNSPWGGGLFWTLLPFWSPYDKDGNPYFEEQIPGAEFYNPDYLSSFYKEENSSFEYLGNLGATIRPLEGLTLRSNISLDVSHGYGLTIRDPQYPWRKNNGYRGDSYSRGVEWTFTNTAEYSIKPHEDHDLIFLVGHEYNRYDGNSFSAGGSGLKDGRLMHLDKVTDPNKKSMKSKLYQAAYLSFFGRLSYSLMDRYHVDLSLRDDASSKFPPRHRHALFWSVGLKWNAKKESFLRDVSWINSLDWKVSTGTAGNSASLGSYDYFALSSTSDKYKGELSRVIAEPGNPDLTWEHQQKTTVGFDGRFFRRLGVNLEVYHRLTTHMVMSVPYPYTTGISSNTKNVGTYQNVGFDLRLDYDVWRGKNGNMVSLYGNINYNRDKVLKLFQGLDTWVINGTNIAYKVGEPVMFCMPIFKQVNPETGDPEWYKPGKDKGDRRMDDSDIVSGNDFNSEALEQNTGISRGTPWRGGLGLRAQYEGFYLDADFTFFLGKHMISNDLFFGNNPRSFKDANTLRSSKNYWKKPGDKTILPAFKYKTLMQFDTRMLLNASFMRLKALSFGYNVPQKYLSGQTFFQGVKVGITCRNLLTFTSFTGPDPEPDMNLTYGRNPASRQFVGSVEIIF